jgi:hypothetical protein
MVLSSSHENYDSMLSLGRIVVEEAVSVAYLRKHPNKLDQFLSFLPAQMYRDLASMKGVDPNLATKRGSRSCEVRYAAYINEGRISVAYHNRSIALYTRLSFKARDLVCLQGPPQVGAVPGHSLREAQPSNLGDCNAVARTVHGHDRSRELSDAIAQGTALVVEHEGRIAGYSADLAYYAHAVAESTEDMKALILSGRLFGGAGILVPTSNFEQLRGLQLVLGPGPESGTAHDAHDHRALQPAAGLLSAERVLLTTGIGVVHADQHCQDLPSQYLACARSGRLAVHRDVARQHLEVLGAHSGAVPAQRPPM